MEQKNRMDSMAELLKKQDFHAALKLVGEVEKGSLESVKLYIMIHEALEEELQDVTLSAIVRDSYEHMKDSVLAEIKSYNKFHFTEKEMDELVEEFKDFFKDFSKKFEKEFKTGKDVVHDEVASFLDKAGKAFIRASKKMNKK